VLRFSPLLRNVSPSSVIFSSICSSMEGAEAAKRLIDCQALETNQSDICRAWSLFRSQSPLARHATG
jgi:hypothetical protein